MGQVIDLMRRLDLGDPDVTGFYDDYVNAKGLFPEISSVHHGGHFAVATLEFDKGDRIRLHNHPDMTGVILCVSGAVEVEAYDLLDHKSDQGNEIYIWVQELIVWGAGMVMEIFLQIITISF